jgi:hypothetical protein
LRNHWNSGLAALFGAFSISDTTIANTQGHGAELQGESSLRNCLVTTTLDDGVLVVQ